MSEMNSTGLAIGQQEPCSSSTLSIPQLQNLAPLRHSGPTPRESRPYPIRQVLPPRRRATGTQYRRDRAVFLQSLLPQKISLPSLTSSPSSIIGTFCSWCIAILWPVEVVTEGSCVIGRKQLDVAGGGRTWFEAVGRLAGRAAGGVLAGKLTVFVTQSSRSAVQRGEVDLTKCDSGLSAVLTSISPT